MYNFFLVYIFDSQQKLDEPFDYLLLGEGLVVGFAILEVFLEIAFFGVLHDDANWFLFDERLDVGYYVAVVQLLHQFYLLQNQLFALFSATLQPDLLSYPINTLMT